jgi:hypothetical protein
VQLGFRFNILYLPKELDQKRLCFIFDAWRCTLSITGDIKNNGSTELLATFDDLDQCSIRGFIPPQFGSRDEPPLTLQAKTRFSG